ncbi:MAG: AAA family ATPase [Phycisphaerae bacterium]|nr:AAA family ATPase [Phycisphaerae bacterium]
MGAILAFSGKGGSGKSNLAALVLRQLIRAAVKPVLAVDADPNATLGLMLGVPVESTIADLRDRMGEAATKVSEIPKERLMDQWLAEILSEEKGFDLLTMGRPEGPKCYCYVNSLLRRYLKELRGSYAVVVVDCEAGMEYLSRLTVDDIDTLVLVAEATSVGLTSARRIAQLADALPVRVKRRVLAVNKVGQPGPAETALDDRQVPGAAAVVRVPFDEDLYRRCAGGEPLDDQAGEAARPAIESLTRLCLPQLCQDQPTHR